MFISNQLKQNKANKELQDKLKKNIQKTSDLVKAILPEQLINENEEKIKEALEKYEVQGKLKTEEKKKYITFKYPTKTIQEAKLAYHKKVQEEETEFRENYKKWNEKIYTAHQERGYEAGQHEGIRIQENKPYYIAPKQTVVKVGDTHYELQMSRKLNETTNILEWERLGMDILERADTNDTKMEDSCTAFEGKNKKKIDWEITLDRLKQQGEKLGYGKSHYLIYIQRIMSQNDDNIFQIYKEEQDPEKIANNLLSKYKTINKKKIFETQLKTLTRVKGQSIREIMCQADTLTDRILQNCKIPGEKSFRKYQILLDALKSFSGEENSKELIQVLKGSSLGGERPDIAELIDTIELAERINESSKPTKNQTFMNEGTAETCEIFAVNSEGASNQYRNVTGKDKDRRQRSSDRSSEESREDRQKYEARREDSPTRGYNRQSNSDRRSSSDRENRRENWRQEQRESENYRDNHYQNREQTSERYNYWDRDESRERDKDKNRSKDTRTRYGSQSRDYNNKIVPFYKRNLERIEYPPLTQMDLTTKFCVKCMNSIEKHYPWDCKLFRYWNENPCDICYNGQHKEKECRRNPHRVDAFSVMMKENT